MLNTKCNCLSRKRKTNKLKNFLVIQWNSKITYWQFRVHHSTLMEFNNSHATERFVLRFHHTLHYKFLLSNLVFLVVIDEVYLCICLVWYQLVLTHELSIISSLPFTTLTEALDDHYLQRLLYIFKDCYIQRLLDPMISRFSECLIKLSVDPMKDRSNDRSNDC